MYQVWNWVESLSCSKLFQEQGYLTQQWISAAVEKVCRLHIGIHFDSLTDPPIALKGEQSKCHWPHIWATCANISGKHSWVWDMRTCGVWMTTAHKCLSILTKWNKECLKKIENVWCGHPLGGTSWMDRWSADHKTMWSTLEDDWSHSSPEITSQFLMGDYYFSQILINAEAGTYIYQYNSKYMHEIPMADCPSPKLSPESTFKCLDNEALTSPLFALRTWSVVCHPLSSCQGNHSKPSFPETGLNLK